MSKMPEIILASSSKYRCNLLNKLQIPFQAASPDINEQAVPGESAADLVARLSLEKARALASQFPRHLIIGSDQVAVLGDKILTKPHTHERAREQLAACSGQAVRFLTGLCLYNSTSGTYQLEVVSFEVKFLNLSTDQIENYLIKETPYDCAGSFKCEGLGITLFEKLMGDDFNALVGLPLIRLTHMLRQEGVEPLSAGG